MIELISDASIRVFKRRAFLANDVSNLPFVLIKFPYGNIVTPVWIWCSEDCFYVVPNLNFMASKGAGELEYPIQE